MKKAEKRLARMEKNIKEKTKTLNLIKELTDNGYIRLSKEKYKRLIKENGATNE